MYGQYTTCNAIANVINVWARTLNLSVALWIGTTAWQRLSLNPYRNHSTPGTPRSWLNNDTWSHSTSRTYFPFTENTSTKNFQPIKRPSRISLLPLPRDLSIASRLRAPLIYPQALSLIHYGLLVTRRNLHLHFSHSFGYSFVLHYIVYCYISLFLTVVYALICEI